jgi:neutral ceramidase
MNLKALRLAVLLMAGLMALGRSFAAEALWQAGIAKTIITPTESLWLAGYASRDKAADGKVMELWCKALALQDAAGHKAVFLTSDTLGIPQSMYQHVCGALKEKYGLEPAQVILSASHTHCGPVLHGALSDMYPLDAKQWGLIDSYSTELEGKIVATVGQALAALAPARLATAQGTAGFAVNRRTNAETQVSALIAQGALKGPIDHTVPVLAVFAPDGKLRAVLFGYACHNTTMDFTKWSGDYAGFAQLALEKSHPDAAAMFFMGCGGDQNPLPRRQPELAERYGNMLAAAVEEALLSPPKPLAPELQTSMEMVSLNLGPAPTEAELAKMTADKSFANRQWAKRLLGELRSGKNFMRSYPYPLQVWRLGGTQLLVTLGGEPVVDYALKFKREFGPQTWVAGYCNDVMTYIPSQRVLGEGGYEGGRAMIVYGLPAWRWDDDVEDLITASARRLVARVQTQPAGN